MYKVERTGFDLQPARLGAAFAVLLIPILIWVFWLATEGAGLYDAVALDHAVTARNIAAGRGITSDVMTPLHLRIEDSLEKADPVFARPAPALWEGFWSWVLNPTANVMIASSGFFFIAASWLVFLLAARFHSLTAAWMSFLVFVLNPQVLDLSTSGRPEPMGMFLVALLFMLVSGKPPLASIPRIPWGVCLGSGLTAGVLLSAGYYLTFPLAAVFGWYWLRWARQASREEAIGAEGRRVHPLLIAAGWILKRRGYRMLLLFLAGMAVFPALVYAGRVFVPGAAPAGVDRFLVTVNTSVALGWSYWREYAAVAPDLSVFFSLFTPAVMVKWVAGLSYSFTSLFEVFQPAVFAFFMLALFFPEHGEKFGYRWMLLTMMSLQIFIMSFFYWDRAFLAIWTPVVIVTGVGTFTEFIQQRITLHRAREAVARPLKHRLRQEFILYVAPLLMILLFTAGLFFLRLKDRVPPERLKPSLSADVMREEPDLYRYIVTPSPWMVAWHTGIPTVWMPETERHMRLLEDRFGEDFRTVYLPRNRSAILHDRVPAWWFFAMQEKTRLPGYRLARFTGFGEAVYVREGEPEAE